MAETALRSFCPGIAAKASLQRLSCDNAHTSSQLRNLSKSSSQTIRYFRRLSLGCGCGRFALRSSARAAARRRYPRERFVRDVILIQRDDWPFDRSDRNQMRIIWTSIDDGFDTLWEARRAKWRAIARRELLAKSEPVIIACSADIMSKVLLSFVHPLVGEVEALVGHRVKS